MPLLTTLLTCLAAVRAKAELILSGHQQQQQERQRQQPKHDDVGEKVGVNDRVEEDEKMEFCSLFDALQGTTKKIAVMKAVSSSDEEEEIIIVPRRA